MSALPQLHEDFWDLPGGRLHAGEDLSTTLMRELNEELPGISNIRIGPLVHLQPGQYDLAPNLRLMLIFYSVSAKLPDSLTLSPEHAAARWITRAELSGLPIPDPDQQAIIKSFDS